jgi:hypothetical protein
VFRSRAAQSGINEAEKAHAEKTAAIGGASLQMADIAMQKAAHPRVREFAKFEHDEQTTVAAVLKSRDPSFNPPAPPAEVAAALDKQANASWDGLRSRVYFRPDQRPRTTERYPKGLPENWLGFAYRQHHQTGAWHDRRALNTALGFA